MFCLQRMQLKFNDLGQENKTQKEKKKKRKKYHERIHDKKNNSSYSNI